MSNAKKIVGELFKAKRQEMNLTLKEIENATSIRTMYLQAIEEGDIEKYISNVYAMGFIRQYGAFLGLDTEKLFAEHPTAYEKIEVKQDFDYGIGTLEVRNHSSNRVKSLPSAAWIAISVGGVLLLWLAMRLFKVF